MKTKIILLVVLFVVMVCTSCSYKASVNDNTEETILPPPIEFYPPYSMSTSDHKEIIAYINEALNNELTSVGERSFVEFLNDIATSNIEELGEVKYQYFRAWDDPYKGIVSNNSSIGISWFRDNKCDKFIYYGYESGIGEKIARWGYERIASNDLYVLKTDDEWGDSYYYLMGDYYCEFRIHTTVDDFDTILGIFIGYCEIAESIVNQG